MKNFLMQTKQHCMKNDAMPFHRTRTLTLVAPTDMGATTGAICCRSLLLFVAETPLARGSSRLLTLSGRFFFNFAKIDDSRSGNGGISSRTVA
jgi:hypothetical protein